MRKSGTIKIGARAGEMGLIVLSAKTLDHARTLVESDIAIVNGLFKAVIYPYHVFYPGCVDR